MQSTEVEDEDDDDYLWLLGFLEEPDTPLSLLRHKFPSKVGGRPAWLNPVAIPPPPALVSKPGDCALNFLLQVYCPLDDNELAFHRTIFLFVPQDGRTLKRKGGVRAFRSQLGRRNDFYSFEPSKDSFPPQQPDSSKRSDPWSVLEYERSLASDQSPPDPVNRHIFPEKLLLIDEEQPPSTPARQGQTEDASFTANDVGPDVEAAIASNTSADQKHFAEFASRVSWDPEQVLRYCFQDGAEPLWPSPSPVPKETDIPNCQHCSSRRKFEFQVMPQLLISLGIDDEQESALDWGTLAVYSCEASCDVGNAYAEEFVWVQP